MTCFNLCPKMVSILESLLYQAVMTVCGALTLFLPPLLPLPPSQCLQRLPPSLRLTLPPSPLRQCKKLLLTYRCTSCPYFRSLLSRLFSFTYRRVFVSHSADNPLVSASLGASTDVDNGPHVTKKAVIGTDINGPESCSLATSGLLINGPLLFFFNHFP